jgi:uncharacterized protein (TIGR01777 family)
MKVAISGVTGMIGSALASSLRADGHDVVGISRRPGDGDVVWDVAARTIDADGLEGLDAIVHLAGESIQGRWTSAKRSRIMRSRVDSTDLLVDTIEGLDARPRVLVSGSGVDYYGDRGDELLTEEAAPGSGFLAEVTQRWEAAATRADAFGVRVACARTSMVLSPGGGALQRLLTITRFGLGGPLGSGRQFWSWVTLDDEVRALRHLIDHDVEGPANLATPTPVRQREFADTLGAALHRPTILPAPGFAIKAALGQMGEELLLGSKRAVPSALERSGFDFQQPLLGPALESLLAD